MQVHIWQKNKDYGESKMDTNVITKKQEKKIGWTDNNEKLGGITLVEHLFKRIDDLFIGRFMSSFKTPEHMTEAMATWADCLTKDRITLEEVKEGLNECRRKKFPPSYGEFLECCRPKFDYFACFYEAINGLTARKYGKDFSWSSPAIYHAAVEFGEYDIMTKSYSVCEKRWQELLNKHAASEDSTEIPKAQKALTYDRKTRDKELAKESIDKLKGILNKRENNETLQHNTSS